MGGLLLLLIIYLIGGLTASLFYHRILSHRVVFLRPWFEHTLAILSLPAGTPIQWVGTHRKHHRFTDQPGDPHSPVLDGFWFAHTGWYLGTRQVHWCLLYALGGPLRLFWDAWWRPRTNQENNTFAPDLQQDSFYRNISLARFYTPLLILYGCVLVFSSYLALGFEGLFWLWLGMLIVYNLGDGLNSLGHGSHNGQNGARNLPVLAWFTFGEGFHRKHHEKPSSLVLSASRWSADYFFLTLMLRCKLAQFQPYD